MSRERDLSRRDFLGTGAALGFGAVLSDRLIAGQKDSTGTNWSVGIYTRPWDQYEYLTALDAIAEAGFKYAGLMTTKSQSGLVISSQTSLEQAAACGQEAKKRGLRILSVYGGDIGVDKSLERGIADLRRLIDNCAACGCGNLLMGGVGNAGLYDLYYKAISECCDYAAHKRVHLSLKPHGGLNATGSQCRQTIERVGHPNFRIWYDPGNIYYYSNGALNPVDDATTVNGLVTGMCVKDYRHPREVLLRPGTGQVDFPVVFALLRKGGFVSGPLLIECLERSEPKPMIEQAKKARQFVEQCIDQEDRRILRRFERTLQAGVAEADITPPTGYRMSGYFHERLSTGTANPLKAKALVLRQGHTKAAFVSCDIIGISPQVALQARKTIAERTMIPESNAIVAATHSHTGPLYWGALRNHFHATAIAGQGSDPCETVDYPARLTEAVAAAVGQANRTAESVDIRAGAAEQTGLSFNRRFHMKDGSVRFNPGVLNPDIVKAAGPIDPQIGILTLYRRGSDKPFAGLVNFTLHLDTVGGTLYNADYPFHIEQALRKEYGDDFTLLFGTGTCGDINHINVTKRERLTTETIGTTLGQTVIEKAPLLDPAKASSLAIKRGIVSWPLQQCSPEKIVWARENMHKIGTAELPFLEQVEAYKIMAIQARESETIDLETQIIRIGPDIAIVGLPGEAFVELGLAIKEASPFRTTIVIELCNDYPGYLPTEKAFREGSYETVNSRIQPGGGEALAAAAIKLLRDLKSL
ncbi:MAG: neutral/alkaline non-lysosomal ceramidase N-terminal domain-containing protein [Sedimentisphaerales bacterium]|nr:neutral/alkaline non-lysosomal ceramidase N-terminal domain-containing protein [Sedimentisphaerales bacterium]